MDKIEGFLEVGRNDKGEVVINHPDLKPDENGVGHIIFSVNQARNLARLLEEKAREIEAERVHSEKIKELDRRLQEFEVRNTRLGPREKTEKEVLQDDRILDAIIKDVKDRTGKDLVVGEEIPPVDRTKRCMLSGNPETPDHRELRPDGMQKDYVVLCPQERARGFVRPVRRTYRHKVCNTTTTMGLSLAETYARDPEFYSGTFCVCCHGHFPLDQFVWEGTDEQVGT